MKQVFGFSHSSSFRPFVLTLFTTVLLAFMFVSTGFAQARGLTTVLALERDSYAADEPVNIMVSVTNNATEAITFCKRNTPLEGFLSDMFVVEWQGGIVRYEGVLVKRLPPTPDEFLTLEPGETVSAVLDLSRVYDLSVNGEYRVTLSTVAASRVPVVSYRLTSADVGFDVTGGADHRAIKEIDVPFRSYPPPAPTFVNCDSAQQACANQALDAARTQSANCKAYLQNLPEADRPTNAHYKRWYGDYSATCYDKVLNNWCKIADALNTQTITFICGDTLCTPSTYAFVYPNDPYKIYLCPQFFAADVSSGVDTKMGTLIHEMSHFNVVAGTDDHAYGVANCEALADSNAALAKDNADNYEYFAETKPAGPVPVFITHFDARSSGFGVELAWEIFADEAVAGFRVYRRSTRTGPSTLVSDGLIPASARRFTDADVTPGNVYHYTLGAVTTRGPEYISNTVTIRTREAFFTLEQNTPNPFNPGTTIGFTLHEDGPVYLGIYDANGRQVRTLVRGERTAGRHVAKWNGLDDRGVAVSSGVYFYQLTSRNQTLTRKMVLLK